MKRRILTHLLSNSIVFICLPLLAGCSTDAQQSDSETGSKRRLLANAPKEMPPENPEPPPEPPPPQPAPAPVPQYSKARLKSAAEIHNWSNIHIDGTSIDAWLKTKWTNGAITVRLALLGGQEDLERFCASVKQFRLKFGDTTGNIIMEFTIDGPDLTFAPPGTNQGVPTMQFESSIECPLEQYESAHSWQLYWDH